MCIFSIFRLTEREKERRRLMGDLLKIENEFEETLELENAKRYCIPADDINKVGRFGVKVLIF